MLCSLFFFFFYMQFPSRGLAMSNNIHLETDIWPLISCVPIHNQTSRQPIVSECLTAEETRPRSTHQRNWRVNMKKCSTYITTKSTHMPPQSPSQMFYPIALKFFFFPPHMRPLKYRSLCAKVNPSKFNQMEMWHLISFTFPAEWDDLVRSLTCELVWNMVWSFLLVLTDTVLCSHVGDGEVPA